MMMRTNVEILVRALMSGHVVNYRNYQYKLIKAGEDIVCPSGIYESTSDVLVNLTEMINDNGTMQVMMPCQLSFNDILQMATDMSEMERLDIISSQVLMSMNKQR